MTLCHSACFTVHLNQMNRTIYRKPQCFWVDTVFVSEADNKMLVKHLKWLCTKWGWDFLFMNKKKKNLDTPHLLCSKRESQNDWNSAYRANRKGINFLAQPQRDQVSSKHITWKIIARSEVKITSSEAAEIHWWQNITHFGPCSGYKHVKLLLKSNNI